MKKVLFLLAAAAACAIALPATAARNKTLKGSGRIVTETRDVGSFHAVEAGSIAHVLVGDYPAGRVTVKTDDNLLVHVQTSVAEGTLRIGLADVTVQNAELTVYVPAAGITRLDAKGIAAFSLETPLTGITGLKAGGAAKITAEHPLQTNDAAIEASGRATLIVFLLWILTIVATGGLILREYGGEQRHRLHELFDEARDELRDREIDRMQEWVAADTVSVIATEPAPQTAPASDSAHRITIKGPKKQKVDIRVTEHSVDIDFDDESYE